MSSDAQANSLSQGAQLLQQKILQAVQGLNLPSAGATQTELQNGIRQNLDAVAFDKHNQTGIVEARATFELSRDSDKLFELEIIWDADNPTTDSEQRAHYGYEIYKDGKRVAGPGHVFFEKQVILPYYRLKSLGQTEEHSLKLAKSGTMGNGLMKSETHYFKVNK
ncbi:hypothetical protein DL766_002886 [Monosporascus sp. MC13-8B]|uniref:Uncharacterized protein n=1 Tax=Monosporascus cannonballus TaxID=155416 RepID=A0ABY0H794_9PEZI|nr:hypothetical protein DL762_004598 [Monosporascus cannonballus]RYO96269.1 hypothetical protein DL763_003296 [Monosporascus cannonballus]RYP34667.1 hypothetical protein DL766_002886 [Monosporascus sp. MC13-8B]